AARSAGARRGASVAPALAPAGLSGRAISRGAGPGPACGGLLTCPTLARGPDRPPRRRGSASHTRGETTKAPLTDGPRGLGRPSGGALAGPPPSGRPG